ncbi:LysM peptidoglycan-binding domain-containing protein [Metallumcola ferriviriculae]|uniref:LysM peptidoglycan-binding domain-containing protein n=1 Tax=Metallumcola ferriviriculae TaxID=3039180 RepID=A0AAU0URU5_9FIRM|nr:LysM peptidoglycan-binding domain-containing protein [Desulfitibacteraceae bacterium MK1]
MNEEKKRVFENSVRQTPPSPSQCSGILYTITPGDTLFILSTRFGTPLRDIIAANPQIDDPNAVVPGQRVCIPLPPPPQTCSGFYLTVSAGDTLVQISQRFGVRLVDILIANPQIVNPEVIFARQTICIPIPPPADIPCSGFFYTVKQGETLNQISARFNVTVREIFAANPQIVDPGKIFAGQKICIPSQENS